jgi:hypothetical protein
MALIQATKSKNQTYKAKFTVVLKAYTAFLYVKFS